MANIDIKPWEIKNIDFEIYEKMKFFQKFTFYDESKLLEIMKYYKIGNINEIINKLNEIKIQTDIIISQYKFNEIINYIFIFDEIILLTNQEKLQQNQQYKSYLKDNFKSLLFLEENVEKYFYDFVFNQKLDSDSKNNNCIEIKNKTEIEKLIMESIIKKSQILTIKNRRKYNPSQYNVNNEFKYNDFISIKKIPRYIDLCYNIHNQLLYILKCYSSTVNYQHEIDFYDHFNGSFPYISNMFGKTKCLSTEYIVVEYIEGETLDKFILNNKNIDISIKFKIIVEILFAVQYIHSNGFFLRDLKLGNIMVDSSLNAILIDFDYSKKIKYNNSNKEEENDDQTVNNGDCIYISPEQIFSNNCTYKADSYSIGMIIHFILTGIPYDHKIITYDYLKRIYSNKENISNQYDFPKINDEYASILKEYQKCFDILPESRPKIREIIINFVFYINDNKIKKNLPYIIKQLDKYQPNFKINNNNKINYDEISFISYFMGCIYYFGEHISPDINKSIYYLTLSSNQNNSDAQCFLGKIYYEGKYITRDINKSIYYFTLSSNQNNSNAQCFLGKIYYEGKYISRDINKSIYYFTLSSNQDNSDAQCFLGMVYYEGKYIEQDINKSIYYLTLSSNKNNLNAQFFLGLFYYYEANTTSDINKSIYYLTLLSNKNNSYAQYILGKIYYNGEYIVRDINKSIYYLTLSSNQYNSDAQYLLGKIYYKGKYITQDINKSIYYLTLSSNHYNSDAQCLLGIIYYEGKYIARDINKSIHYFTLSSNKNNSNAQFFLGWLYYYEESIAFDINKSIYYLNLSSKQNNSNAQCLLGEIYYEGKYIARDINKSIFYLTLSSNQNDPDAQCLLGIIYYEGKFTTRDINKSIHYFKESSCFYNNIAKNYLGIIYKDGDGVEKSICNSIIYFNEAIREKNDEYSMYNLSRIYYFGIDVEPNIPKSIELLKQASEKNLRYANLFLFYIYSYGDENFQNNEAKNYYKSKLPQNIQYIMLFNHKIIIERLQNFLKQYNLCHDYDNYWYFLYYVVNEKFYKPEYKNNQSNYPYKKDLDKNFYLGFS